MVDETVDQEPPQVDQGPRQVDQEPYHSLI